MSKFEQIRKSYAEQRSALHSYWTLLQFQAQAFTNGLTKYLELSDVDWVDHSGTKHQYVELGVIDGESFKSQRSHDIGGRDSWLEFAIKVTLDDARNSFPKRSVFCDIKIKKEEGGIQVVSDKLSLTKKIAGAEPPYDYSDVYDAIFKALEKDLAYRP